jgi:hypothetical protein
VFYVLFLFSFFSCLISFLLVEDGTERINSTTIMDMKHGILAYSVYGEMGLKGCKMGAVP